jgi:hypothetical protein
MGDLCEALRQLSEAFITVSFLQDLHGLAVLPYCFIGILIDL